MSTSWTRPEPSYASETQIEEDPDVDGQVALSLQQEENNASLDVEYAYSTMWSEDEQQPIGEVQSQAHSSLSPDELLAHRLQRKENERAREILERDKALLRGQAQRTTRRVEPFQGLGSLRTVSTSRFTFL